MDTLLPMFGMLHSPEYVSDIHVPVRNAVSRLTFL